jgi:hypothetical protein
MRKIVFIVVAVVVLGVIAFFGWREFRVPPITFVTDRSMVITDNHFSVQRLYAIEIDHDAYEAALDEILLLNQEAFSEEERLQAAIAAGQPAFFPSFEFVSTTITNSEGDDEIWVDGFVVVRAAPGQTEARFRMGKTSLEAITQGGLAIERVEVFSQPGMGVDPLPLIQTENNATVDVTGQSSFRVAMSGTTGMLTLQLVYNVDVETPLVLTVLEEQLLQVHITLTVNEFGNITAEFDAESFNSLEQLTEEN